MAGTAIACPHAFDLKYRQKTKPVEPAPESQTVGTVVHKICEFAIQGVPLNRVFDQVLASFDLTHNMREEVLTFRDAVEDFVQRIEGFKTQFKVKKVVPEKKLAITPAFTQTTFFDKKGLFRGVIDVTIITGDDRCVVIDHKSGAQKPLSMHQDQLEGYAVILTANYPTIKAVRAGLNYLGGEPQANGKRIVWAREHDKNHINTRLRQNLIKHLTRAADSAKTDEPKKSWMCNFCGYRPLCPLYK
jgi:ATP-dependent exoDNAse (exonuclease V) beta subunit